MNGYSSIYLQWTVAMTSIYNGRLGTDYLTCKGGGMVFFSFRNIFSDNNSESDNFFPSPHSEYFFQQHWELEYVFFLGKSHTPPPFQVKW